MRIKIILVAVTRAIKAFHRVIRFSELTIKIEIIAIIRNDLTQRS